VAETILSDTGALIWGRRPVPLWPAGLRVVWADRTLPDWLAFELGLPADATYAALSAGVWNTVVGDEVPKPIRDFLRQRVPCRGSAAWGVSLLNREWPFGAKPRDMPWSLRTWNCLQDAGLLDRPDALTRLTAPAMLLLKNAGPVTILDFACVAEVVLAGIDARNAQCGPHAAPDVDDPDWRERVTSTDPRFQDLLPEDMGTLADYARAVSIERGRVADLTRQLRSVERAARRRLSELRGMTLDEALADVVATIGETRPNEVRPLMQRLGLTGSALAPLDGPNAVNRQMAARLRALEKRFTAPTSEPVFLPQLDAAIRVLEALAPCSVEAAAAELRARELTTVTDAVAVVLQAARLFRHRVPAAIDASGTWLRRPVDQHDVHSPDQKKP
jgi:hypothetical protein